MPEIYDRSSMDAELFDPKTPLQGKTCCACGLGLRFSHFQKDSSISDGHAHMCDVCAASPELSVEEHILRMREENFASAQARHARGESPEAYLNSKARIGQTMQCSDFLYKLSKKCPTLVVTQGYVSETGHLEDADLMLYRAVPFCSVGFIQRGLLPEFSIFAFGRMGERTHEEQRGWRTILLRCIQLGMISEERADKVFGKCLSEAGEVYRKAVYNWRNRKV